MWADQHVHSSCSADCKIQMKDMAVNAIERGVEHLCFTDHCDLEYYVSGKYDPDCFDKEKLCRQYGEALRACGERISLCLGLEIGGGDHYPEKVGEILEKLCPDFIIGSVHSLKGKPDFYIYGKEGYYDSRDKCRKILGQYVQEHFKLVGNGDFDVLGHIGYPLRYMKSMGFDLDFHDFFDELEALFKLLIEKGKGIEVNTSGLRTTFNRLLPSPEILKLYKMTGGEIITIGSDAHDVQSVGAGINEAQALLKELGFRYFALYKERKPEFIKL